MPFIFEHHHYIHADPQTHTILERIFTMGQLTQAAVVKLTAEVQDSKTKLGGLVTWTLGEKDRTAAAVADALTAAGIDDVAQAALIEAATSEMSDATDAALEAAGTDSNGNPVPDAPPAEPPVGEDTTGAPEA